jgi:hypothetical protein
MSSSSYSAVCDTAASNLWALESLVLDSLLTEFFSPVASNARKAEIDSVLSSFAEQSDALRQSVELFSSQTVTKESPCSPSPASRYAGLEGNQCRNVRTVRQANVF